ncbi:AT-rich interactive domain-containing protein 3B isoform X1 [Triplophysa dalaica]|uniref:AT-rich interactive domain-containing protein 3B isoform X1 n=2 Tax=Triplophysa dalaica TaxID=1582913 RepID=UPI0024DFB00B|nr:AT-rich interactive domain-containing protein 3B isoform X1 [Triplophysa dalaica]
MVDNSSSSNTQVPSLSQESGLAGAFSQAAFGNSAGVKLEAVMEQLQRQQQAKLEMERKERHLREAHILYAQQLAAQQAIMASARAQGTPLTPDFYSKNSRDRALKAGQGPPAPRGPVKSSAEMEEDASDEMDRGRGSEGDEEDDDEMMDGDDVSEDEESEGLEFLRKQSLALQQAAVGVPSYPYQVYAASPSAAKKRARSPTTKVKDEPEDSLSDQQSFSTPNGLGDWNLDDSFKQNGNSSWNEEGDGGRNRGEASRDFAKLYELDNDPKRKEFLDDLFAYMQKRGTPVNRIPIMAKQVLDLYMLYKLVTEKGGLVEVINKKIWREITKGLNLPTSITSAAFTLRTQYMKYLYPYECEKKGLSSPGELQAAIDSNRREGRRPGYSNSLYRFSPSPSASGPHLLSPPKMHLPATGHNGLQATPSPSLKKATVPEDGPASMLPGRLPLALALGHQQQLARAATLEQLRERLETGMGVGALTPGAAAVEGPERKMARLAEEQQRLLQHAFQQNLLAMASQVNPANMRMNNANTRQEKQDLSLSISSNGSASITVSVEVNGIIYSGSLYAQKSSAGIPAPVAAMSTGHTSTLSPGIPSSSSSSRGPDSVEQATGGSP